MNNVTKQKNKKNQLTPKRLVSKVASKRTLNKNKRALESFDSYKETSDFIDRADISLGRKGAFKVGTGSTLNFEINCYGISSTTA